MSYHISTTKWNITGNLIKKEVSALENASFTLWKLRKWVPLFQYDMSSRILHVIFESFQLLLSYHQYFQHNKVEHNGKSHRERRFPWVRYCLHWGQNFDLARQVLASWMFAINHHHLVTSMILMMTRYQTFSDAMDICEELGERGSFLANFQSYNEYWQLSSHTSYLSHICLVFAS